MLGSSRLSLFLRLLLPSALCSLPVGCAATHQDARSAVLESFREQGDFRRFEDDRELHVASATFDRDRELLLANPHAFFRVGPESGCSLDNSTLYKVTGLDASFRSLDLADTEGEVSAEKMKYSVEGGRCEGGVASGLLDLRVEWTDLVVFPDRKGASRIERAMRFRGALGKSGFEGRLVTFAFTGKMQTRVKVAGEIVDVPDDSPFDATYSVTYSDMKSFMPRVLNGRAVSFRFDRSNSMHVASVTESLPDLRLKVTTWSGAEKASENIVTSELIQDGWQLSYAQRIAGIEIPGSRTCMKQGRAAPENACDGAATSRVE
jgi:hypothetical protein